MQTISQIKEQFPDVVEKQIPAHVLEELHAALLRIEESEGSALTVKAFALHDNMEYYGDKWLGPRYEVGLFATSQNKRKYLSRLPLEQDYLYP